MNSQTNGRPAIKTARNLRHNQPDAETRLWAALRSIRPNGIRYRRQHPIGRYIVDFVCLEKRLIIEIDGGQHALNEEKDTQRTKWLEGEGYRVLRFWNNDVLTNTEGVIFRVTEHLK
jgi:very-short-patch-repair endonuclease